MALFGRCASMIANHSAPAVAPCFPYLESSFDILGTEYNIVINGKYALCDDLARLEAQIQGSAFHTFDDDRDRVGGYVRQ